MKSNEELDNIFFDLGRHFKLDNTIGNRGTIDAYKQEFLVWHNSQMQKANKEIQQLKDKLSKNKEIKNETDINIDIRDKAEN